MKTLVYKGGSDFRKLAEADFAKMDIEHKTEETYEFGVPFEVGDQLAAALLTHPLVFGEFREAREDEPVRPAPDTSALIGNPDQALPVEEEIRGSGQWVWQPEDDASSNDADSVDQEKSAKKAKGRARSSG